MKYTYIIDISDIDQAWQNLEKRCRYEIRRCNEHVWKSLDIERFNEIHKITRPDRVIDEEFIYKVFRDWNCVIFSTTCASAMIGVRGKTGYYLLGARDKRIQPNGSSSKILWEAMKELNSMGCTKFDMCGANKPNIKMFKKSFGGKLVEQPTPCLNY